MVRAASIAVLVVTCLSIFVSSGGSAEEVTSTQVVVPVSSTAPLSSTAPVTSATQTQVTSVLSVPSKVPAPVFTQQTLQSNQTDKHLKPFLEVVRANFKAWDLNGDGVLDRREIELAAQDPAYKGDAAAALAVLKIDADFKTRVKKELELSHLTDLDAIQTKAEHGEKLSANFGRMFDIAVKKLETEPRQLYIESLPHLSTIHQGSTQDCYFLATIGGLLETNPRAIIDMIQPQPDNTFNIVFPGRPAVNVPTPTEAELAAYAFANDGYWLNLIEKGYGKIRHLRPEDYTAEPLDSMALIGGNCLEIIHLLTGHPALRIDFPTSTQINMKDSPFASIKVQCPPPDPALLEKTRAVLKETFAKHKIATASKLRHAYTITAYDIGKDRVILHNPYGINGFEHWADGTKGPRMTNGYFICSVTDFVRYYRCMSVEQ
jgi:hypothetical protein